MSESAITKVYVCSPYAAATKEEIEKNLEFARKACKYVISTNEDKPPLPIAPHLLFPQFMNDNIPEERGLALNFGLNLIVTCDEVWVFGNKLSSGMAGEIKFAQYLPFKKIRFFEETDEKDTFREILAPVTPRKEVI